MVTRPRKDPEPKGRSSRPAVTPKGREHQLISKAVDLAEQQLEDGTASAQVITHYLKLGSTRERLEQRRIELENELTEAKTQHMADLKQSESLFRDAMDYFKAYTGNGPAPSESDRDG